MTDGDQGAEGPVTWPVHHPSPPLPPPRGYGTPGEPPSRTPYVLGVISVLSLLVAVALVFAVFGDDDGPEDASQPASGAGAPTPVGPPKASPTDGGAEDPGDPEPVTCWDGEGAGSVDDCSLPTGLVGLQWVFPSLTNYKCASPSAEPGDGATTRVLCLTRLADGSRAQVGYFEWGTVDQAAAFYASQGLTRTDENGLIRWTGAAGASAKLGVMYDSAPFSVTLIYSAAVVLTPEDLADLYPRPADELKGVPAQ